MNSRQITTLRGYFKGTRLKNVESSSFNRISILGYITALWDCGIIDYKTYQKIENAIYKK
ncbi:MAG: hypothetical protein QXI16_03500 [Sulfolobaceae archaeon]